MRTECMKSKMMYDRPMPGSRLVSLIGDSKEQTSLYLTYHAMFVDKENMDTHHSTFFSLNTIIIEAQANTQNYGRRPYGVGLLVGSYDEDTGPHLYECLPNANCLEYFAISIGAKSQSAKTYLEKFAKDFGDSTCSFPHFFLFFVLVQR